MTAFSWAVSSISGAMSINICVHINFEYILHYLSLYSCFELVDLTLCRIVKFIFRVSMVGLNSTSS